MRHCFIVFAEPGDAFQGVHRTVDGAAHNAAGLGASKMPNGRAMTVDSIRDLLAHSPIVRLPCTPGEEFEAIRIERHHIVL
ncbi:hypothetical protein [Sphingomonas profundi]|uniref:hypothetical protein n=1 Tax=Alterirhizorhabdus profundi TaxID=2681549 RepID=UPI0012E84EDD|nr:hypothetical protein [Sphingomonas profundi]